MLVSSTGLLMLALVLTTSAATASQPEWGPRGGPVRRLELRAAAPGAEPEVRIRPGVSTVLTFDGERVTAPEGGLQVELERRADFTRAELGETVLRLIPSRALKAGDRLRLTVRLKDGAALPLEAALVLVVSTEQADRLVEVQLEPRSPDSPSPEAREAWEAVRQCQEALSRARASTEGPGGLTWLLISGTLDDDGVVSRTLPWQASRESGEPRLATQLRTYRAARRVLVELSWRGGPKNTHSWTVEGTTLTGQGGETLKVVSVWQEPSSTARGSRWVLVEAEAHEGIPPDAWTLRLRGQGPGGDLVLGDIGFARLGHSAGGG